MANAGASRSGMGVPDVEPYEDQLPSFDTEYQKVYLGKDTAIFSCKNKYVKNLEIFKYVKNLRVFQVRKKLRNFQVRKKL